MKTMTKTIKLLTIAEIKEAFKKKGWVFVSKQKSEEKGQTCSLEFNKENEMYSATVFLSFDSFKNTKHYDCDLEIDSKGKIDIHSRDGIDDNFKSINGIIKTLDNEIKDFCVEVKQNEEKDSEDEDEEDE